MLRAKTFVDASVFAPFNQVAPHIQDALGQIAVTHHLKHREPLYQQGDPANALYIVARGGLRLVECTPEGQAIALKIYGVGELLGLLSISGSFPHPTRAEAVVGDTIVYSLPAQAVRALMLEYPSLSLLFIDMLVAHVHQSHARLRQTTAERLDRRLARALLHYALKFGEESPYGVIINVPLSQQDLAQFTGAMVESVNRTLKAWQERGLLTVSRQRLELLDCAALEALAEDNMYSVM